MAAARNRGVQAGTETSQNAVITVLTRDAGSCMGTVQ